MNYCFKGTYYRYSESILIHTNKDLYGDTEECMFRELETLKNNFYDGIIYVEEGSVADPVPELRTYQYIYENGLLIPHGTDEDGRVFGDTVM